jgi:hypothetical protein
MLGRGFVVRGTDGATSADVRVDPRQLDELRTSQHGPRHERPARHEPAASLLPFMRGEGVGADAQRWECTKQDPAWVEPRATVSTGRGRLRAVSRTRHLPRTTPRSWKNAAARRSVFAWKVIATYRIACDASWDDMGLLHGSLSVVGDEEERVKLILTAYSNVVIIEQLDSAHVTLNQVLIRAVGRHETSGTVLLRRSLRGEAMQI